MSRPRRKDVCLFAFAAAFLLLHGICSTVLTEGRLAASYLFWIIAPLFAFAACVRVARICPPQTAAAWRLFAVALALWVAGMLLSAWLEFPDRHQAPRVSYISNFAYFMYGAPILLVISSQVHDRRHWIYTALDGILVTLATYLTYALIFSTPPFVEEAVDPMPVSRLVATYNIENLVLACGATLRLLAYRHAPEQRAFYAVLTLFLWAYGLAAGLYNELAMMELDQQYSLSDLLADSPFLLLAVALLREPPGAEPEARSGFDPLALFIGNFSPIFFTAALIGLGFAVMRRHFYVGMASICITLVVQSLRSALLQSRYMRSERKLREARDKLEKLSQTDGLTGIGNRRYFDQMLALEWQRGKRHGGTLALLMIDIDHFKSLNDAFGHPYGDACLVRVAQALRGAMPRGIDLLARYGGEEFAVILPGTGQDGAERVAAKIRETVAQEKIGAAPARGGWVTVSIGLVCRADFAGPGPEALIAAADQALYQAKQNGRDRVVVATPPV